MTRIEKSESQNVAEAAAPAIPLDVLIAQHRVAYRRDLHIPRITTETPPTYTDPQTGEVVADDMSRIGPTISYPMWAYLHATGPFPWTRGYAFLRADCRKRHPEHLPNPRWRGSLCAELVNLTIRREYAFERACLTLEVTPRRVARVLRSALDTIKDRMLLLAERAEGVTYGGVWPAEPVPEHHVVGGIHQQECPHPECRRRRAA